MVLRNVLIALGALALIAGLTLSVVWLTRPTSPSGGAVGPAPIPEGILVAAHSVAGGTLLQPTDLRWKNTVTATMPPGSIVRSPTTETEFLGAVTRRDFAAGEPFVESELVKAGDRAFLSAVLEPGARAVSIAVDAPQSVAGMVLPGDHVDLILTQNFGNDTFDAAHKSVGETVLRNIRVIAVDQRLTMSVKSDKDLRSGSAGSGIPVTVTLEVSDLEAERILVAAQLGKIQLAIRSLENLGTPPSAADPAPQATWAGDVSPALRMLTRALPQLGPPSEAASRAIAGPTSLADSRPSIEVLRGAATQTR